jgi:hypothetical protein
MNAHVAAVGGVDNIKKVTSMHRSGNASMDGVFGHMEGTFEEISVISQKAYSKMDLTAFMQRSGWNGTVGWAEDTMQGMHEVEGDELELLKTQAQVDLLAAVWMEYGPGAFMLDPNPPADAGDLHAIRIVGVENATYFIDPEDNHVRRIHLPYDDPASGPSTVVVSFDEYTEYDGVKLPDKVTTVVGGGTITIVYDYTETVINGEINDTIFNKP